jgi:hypothetical protein
MGKYILKRVLIFIPTLLAISLITFIISVNAPGDPIEQMLNMNGGGDGQVIDKLASEKAYRAARHQFGFDLPLFYFSITNATCPDTLYRIQDENHRNTLERLSFDNGHWQAVSVYYQTLRGYDLELLRMPRSKENADPVNLARTHIMTLYDSPDDIRIQSQLKELEQLQENPELSNTKSSFMMLRKSYFTLIENKNPWRHYIGTDSKINTTGGSVTLYAAILASLIRISALSVQCSRMPGPGPQGSACCLSSWPISFPFRWV